VLTSSACRGWSISASRRPSTSARWAAHPSALGAGSALSRHKEQ
jgi:hypothetical protein